LRWILLILLLVVGISTKESRIILKFGCLKGKVMKKMFLVVLIGIIFHPAVLQASGSNNAGKVTVTFLKTRANYV